MSERRGSTHTKRATYELRHRIVQGELAGGTRLYEVALADELNISRTPVREAMSRLAEEGLLQRAPGGGFMVRSFTYRDVIDYLKTHPQVYALNAQHNGVNWYRHHLDDLQTIDESMTRREHD